MKLQFVENLDLRERADLLVLPFWEGKKNASTIGHLQDQLSALLQTQDFQGKIAETACVYVDSSKEPRILALGLGEQNAVSRESLRRAYAQAIKQAQIFKATRVNFVFPSELSEESHLWKGVIEGVCLANYTFNDLKGHGAKSASQEITEIAFIGLEPQKVALTSEMHAVFEGVNFARNLVNRNSDDIIPQKIAEISLGLAREFPKIKAKAFDKQWLENEKMGLILAVNQGSKVDPYLVEISYQGNPSNQDWIVLVGKGVTYDTGGLSLKPTDSMLSMKCDMAGAAAVLATIKTVATLELPVNICVLIPTVENAIDANSYKLGDVYRAYNGKTVEINNTDAEGRLILADALSYAVKKWKPKFLIDLATLTGNVVLALGEQMAGFCTNDSQLRNSLLEASKDCSDKLWELPLVADYKEAFKSDIADLVNSGGRDAGMIKGALFLQEFTEDAKWAHIDIAGAAFWSKPKFYHSTKATGYGVQLLIEFLRNQK